MPSQVVDIIPANGRVVASVTGRNSAALAAVGIRLRPGVRPGENFWVGWGLGRLVANGQPFADLYLGPRVVATGPIWVGFASDSRLNTFPIAPGDSAQNRQYVLVVDFPPTVAAAKIWWSVDGLLDSSWSNFSQWR